ncbi:hypothetical protein MAMP_02656 [Methylophaga aminisulfidivorans MP]|uniref:Uncharacterized protein n=1 Tax=Methylophaga aminisulfidivorans MP TaxID=1026882 RepID=F5SVT8_9GAMM|nr:hypothetical protein MAMP_02656 [Methylophaga aminisulfidivorans MP]
MPLVKLSKLSAIQGKPLDLIFCYLQSSNKDNWSIHKTVIIECYIF